MFSKSYSTNLIIVFGNSYQNSFIHIIPNTIDTKNNMCINKPAKSNDIIGAIKAIIVIAAIHSIQAKNIWSLYCFKCSFFIYGQY